MFEPLDRPVIRALVESFSSAWGLDHPNECTRDLADRIAELLSASEARCAAWEGAADGLLARIAPLALDLAAERQARERAEARCAELEPAARDAVVAWRRVVSCATGCQCNACRAERALEEPRRG